MPRKKKPRGQVSRRAAESTPQDSQQSLVQRSTSYSESFAGPIPPPSVLEGYEHVLPGAAERILVMAETQSRHRQELESIVVRGDISRARTGLISGLVLSLAFLCVAGLLIYSGHDWAGVTLGTADLAALVGVFVYGRISRKSERASKHPR